MTATRLFAVPEDAAVPTPVSFPRIERALHMIDPQFTLIPAGDVELDDPECTQARMRISGVNFLVSFTTRGRFLSVRAVWDSRQPASAHVLTTLFTASDSWNREKYFPTVYALPEGETALVVADFMCDVRRGMNDAQLVDNLSGAIATDLDAITFMQHVVASAFTAGNE